MQKVSTCLWFNGQAEEAMNFYTSIFKDSKKGSVSRYAEGSPMPKGTVMTATFQIFGHEFMALNGGPQYTFSPAISFIVTCQTQAEIDDYWHKLSVQGKEVQCGWVTDKYGVSWQIVPSILGELVAKGESAQTQRMMQALWKMTKLDIQKLKDAYDGK